MSLPEPVPNEFDEEPDRSASPRPDSVERPDWLVGAEEGAEAEMGRQPTLPGPNPIRLTRPDEGVETPTPPGAPERVGLPLPDAARPTAGPKKPVAWTAAASSVPQIMREPLAETAKAARPARTDDFDREDAPFPAHDMPPAGIDESDSEGPAARPAAHARGPALAPLREPWWVVALDELRNNRRVHLLLAVLCAAFLAFTFWPRSDNSVSLGEIVRHHERYDGTVVHVHGRIGDVFPVAGGYAFNLHQGRDTLVVFTRTRVPIENEHVSLRASVSTGYLDGQPRLALFEEKSP